MEKTKTMFDAIVDDAMNDVFTPIAEILRRNGDSNLSSLKRLTTVLAARRFSRSRARNRETIRFFQRDPFATDEVFADSVGVSQNTARLYRSNVGIPPYNERVEAARRLMAKQRDAIVEYVKQSELNGQDLINAVSEHFGIHYDILWRFHSLSSLFPLNVRVRFYEPLSEEEADALYYEIDNNLIGAEAEKSWIQRTGKSVSRLKKARDLLTVREEVDSYLSFKALQQSEREFARNCCLRPEQYVCDVCGAGYLGVNLPQENFDIYMMYYHKKNQRFVEAIRPEDEDVER